MTPTATSCIVTAPIIATTPIITDEVSYDYRCDTVVKGYRSTERRQQRHQRKQPGNRSHSLIGLNVGFLLMNVLLFTLLISNVGGTQQVATRIVHEINQFNASTKQLFLMLSYLGMNLVDGGKHFLEYCIS